MKNKGIKIIVLALIVLVTVVVSVLYVGMNDGKYVVAVNLYFFDSQSSMVKEEARDVSYDDKDEIIKKIVKEIDRGPRDSGLERIVPQKTHLKDIIYKDGGKVVLDFDEDFLVDEDSKNVLAAYTVIKSVCCVSSVTGVSQVKITVDGEAITTTDGKPLEYLGYDDIEL